MYIPAAPAAPPREFRTPLPARTHDRRRGALWRAGSARRWARRSCRGRRSCPPARGGCLDLNTDLRPDSDFLFASVAESESHGAIDIDGASVEQRHAKVWAELQLLHVKVGGFLMIVVVGG